MANDSKLCRTVAPERKWVTAEKRRRARRSGRVLRPSLVVDALERIGQYVKKPELG